MVAFAMLTPPPDSKTGLLASFNNLLMFSSISASEACGKLSTGVEPISTSKSTSISTFC